MTRYRKLPIEVDAFQMTDERRSDTQEWPLWLLQAANEGLLRIERHEGATEALLIKTLEGLSPIFRNNWLIRGVVGEIYPCAPEVFEKTYVPIAEHGHCCCLRAIAIDDEIAAGHDHCDIPALDGATSITLRNRGEVEGWFCSAGHYNPVQTRGLVNCQDCGRSRWHRKADEGITG